LPQAWNEDSETFSKLEFDRLGVHATLLYETINKIALVREKVNKKHK